MAFFRDELGPTVEGSRRQWKTVVMGRKEPPLAGFATIAEEKEDEISSSDDSLARSNIPQTHGITSRLTDRLNNDLESSFRFLNNFQNSPKMNTPEVKTLMRGSKALVGKVTIKNASPVGVGPATAVGGLQSWPAAALMSKDKTPSNNDTPCAPAGPKKPVPAAMTPKPKQNQEKRKAPLNMKEAVSMYKNISYGSKDNIKTFVEKLAFVKDDKGVDKDLVSVMNLNVLEQKIKDLGKLNKDMQPVKQQGKHGKTKKSRKTHLESLARHKVVKIPNTLEYTYSPDTRSLTYGTGKSKTIKQTEKELKEPWRYVGTQSVLDKGYFVYPITPTEVKKTFKAKKNKKTSTKQEQGAKVTFRAGSWNIAKGSRSMPSFNLTNSLSSLQRLSARCSATTVCDVEFFPTMPRKSLSKEGCLLYLHDHKATHVQSPYVNKQFSRVTFLRKGGAPGPLVRGVDREEVKKRPLHGVSVKTLPLPQEKTRAKLLKLLDFDEDIEVIDTFLLRQNEAVKQLDTNKPNKTMSHPVVTFDDHLHYHDANTISPEHIIGEITNDIKDLNSLPDTQENRELVAEFFNKLDERIEATKTEHYLERVSNRYSQLVPVVGY